MYSLPRHSRKHKVISGSDHSYCNNALKRFSFIHLPHLMHNVYWTEQLVNIVCYWISAFMIMMFTPTMMHISYSQLKMENNTALTPPFGSLFYQFSVTMSTPPSSIIIWNLHTDSSKIQYHPSCQILSHLDTRQIFAYTAWPAANKVFIVAKTSCWGSLFKGIYGWR